jgi:hypothetical protein
MKRASLQCLQAIECPEKTRNKNQKKDEFSVIQAYKALSLHHYIRSIIAKQYEGNQKVKGISQTR